MSDTNATKAQDVEALRSRETEKFKRAQDDFLAACCEGSPSKMQSALRSGADANVPENVSSSSADVKDELLAIHFAARNGHAEIVSELCSRHRVDADSRDGRGRTALSHAVVLDRVEVAKVLVNELRADVHCEDDFEESPLVICARVGSPEMMRVLLKKCAEEDGGTEKNVEQGRGRFGLPILAEAACGRTDEKTFPEVANLIKEHVLEMKRKKKKQKNVEDDSKENEKDVDDDAAADEEEFTRFRTKSGVKASLLMLACGLGNEKSIRFLCDEWNMNPNGRDDDESAPLEVAKGAGHEACVKELEKRGAKEREKKKTVMNDEKVNKDKSKYELNKRKARVQELIKERERLSFILQANEDEIFQRLMRQPRIEQAVKEVVEDFMNVQKYGKDQDVIAALSRWRGCQRFFKSRGEKVEYDEVVIKEGKEDEIKRRKEQLHSLSERIASELMNVAKEMKGEVGDLDLTKYANMDDDELDEFEKEEREEEERKQRELKADKEKRVFYYQTALLVSQLIPFFYALFLFFFNRDALKNPFRSSTHSKNEDNMHGEL